MNDIGEVSNGLTVEDSREQSSPVVAETGTTQNVHAKRKKKRKKPVAKANIVNSGDALALKQTNVPKEQPFPKERSKMETSTSSDNQSPPCDSESSAVGTSSVAASKVSSNSAHINNESPTPEVTLDLVQRLWLEINHLSLLKKRNVKHPSAHFYCKLCSYYCMSLSHCEEHTQEQKHCRRSMEHGEFTTLINLPTPTKKHIDALSEMLSKFSSIFGLSDEEKEARVQFANRMDAFISEHLPGCGVRLYGSSITGVALKCSNINLDFHVASHLSAPSMLKAAFNLLHESCNFVRGVSRDFHDEIPSVFFFDDTGLVRCVLSLNSHEAHKTSELLASYQPLDPRVKILGTCFRLWAKMCKIDDHLMGLLPAYSYNLLLIYFLQQVQPPVLPVLKESNPELSWTSTNTMALGELWVKLFRFYAVDYPNSENVICIRSKEPVKRIDKHWTGKKIAIEDPYLPKRNVSRYIVNHASHDFIQDCLKHSYKYFGIPQTDQGPIFYLIKKPMEEYRQIPDVENNIKRAESSLNAQMDIDDRFTKLADADTPSAVTVRNMISVSELEEKLRETSLHNSGSQDPNSSCSAEAQSSNAPVKLKAPNNCNYSSLIVSPKLAEALCKRLKKEYHCFKMDADAFTLGKLPPTVCIICQQEGHARTHCPDNHFPPLQPLPPMQEFFIELLDEMCCRIFKNWSPTIQEIEARQSIVNDLEAYLRGSYPPVKLELFGSSCNGFGFHRSDLDICLTFMDNKTGEDINYVSLIEELVRYLKAYGKLTNLIPITTAKVPIVKFTYPRYRVDCDISLYNTLAQRNTHMLRTYAQIDKRVQILGFTMKYFAKLCDICDASRGSLSSYAYILMVIYFLQQCNPPVIPVLQQLHPTEQKPEVIVEGWNTWFYDGPNHLSAVWPGYGKNTASPGLLWLQMLRFYTEEFDFNEYVVCIRQKEKLLRFEKLWNSKCMAIEDPFDLTHNLGSGLSRKMNNFIIKAFRNGRMHFGTPLQRPPMPYSDLMLYLFEPKFLCDGQPPNDRGCRICKKIGHICKDCPQRKGNKKRPVEKRAEKAGGSPANKARDQTNNHRGREGIQQGENARPKREHVPQPVRNPQAVQQVANHHQQKQQPLLPHPHLQQLQKLHNAASPRNVASYQPQQVNPTPQEMLLNAVAGAATQQNNWWPAQGQAPPLRPPNFPAGHPFQPNFRFPHPSAPHPHFPGPTPVNQFNMTPPPPQVTQSTHVPMQSTTTSEGQLNVPKGPSRKPHFHKKNAHEGNEIAAGSSTDPQVNPTDVKKNQAPQHKKRPTLYFRRSTPPQQ